jgi:hypothetical protein
MAVLFAAGNGGRWVLVAHLRRFNRTETKKNQQSNIEIYA